MQFLWKDMQVGVRALRRMPGSAIISIIVLGLGIGLCSFMFSLVYGVFYRGLDVPESNRVFVLYTTHPEEDVRSRSVPIHDLVDWRERQTSFTGLLAVTGNTVNLGSDAEPHRYQGAYVSANAFRVLGVAPILGRGFAEGEDAPGSPPNVVLGYAAWRDDFGLDRAVLGRTVRVNGQPAEIIGVMPEGFAFPMNHEIWLPFRDDPQATVRGNGRSVQVYGRLLDDVTRDRAELELATIARQLAVEYPETNEGYGARLETPELAASGGEIRLVFGAMMVAVLCVLLVACANVANLLLARAAMRSREAGIRVAMGGSRLRVMTPFFAEAFVLAAAGALLGIAIAFVAITWFDAVTDPAVTGRPYFIRFALDLPILAFVGGLIVFTAIAAGVAPALQMSRTNVNEVLKDESRGSSGLHMGKLSHVLVTAEVALSCALLVGTGLMAKSILRLGGVDYPFETERLFTADVGLFAADYPDRDARMQLWEGVLREIRALPGAASVGLTTLLPHEGENTRRIAIDGVAYENDEAMPTLNRVAVTPGYFETLGSGIAAGRDFSDADNSGAQRVAIVNQPMVERYFDGQNPIGRQFREGPADTLPRVTVVGIVPDLGIGGPDSEVFGDFEPAGYYLPLDQTDAAFLSIAVLPRAGDALAMTRDVREAVRRTDPDLPIYNVRTEAQVIARRTWFYGVFGSVFIVFGIAALFMASVGLYGVLAFAVTRRTREMGIRMALGAATRDVIRLVARQGAYQLGVGLAIGLGLAFGLTRLIGFMMYQVDPQDPLVFAAVIATIAIVGMAAAVFPARRATRVDPVDALRYD